MNALLNPAIYLGAFLQKQSGNADCIIILTKMRFQLKMQVPTHWEIFILSSTFWLFPGLIC